MRESVDVLVPLSEEVFLSKLRLIVHLAMDLFWSSLVVCVLPKLGDAGLKRLVFWRFLFPSLEEGGSFPPNTWDAGVAQLRDKG